MNVDTVASTEFCTALNEMTASFTSVREVISSLKSRPDGLDTKDGISLLSIKHHVLLSYLQSLLLISTRRALGESLTERSSPTQPFSSRDRGSRGFGAGDLVDSMLEGRVVLEKVKTLEGRMRYQIEKLVRLATEPEATEAVINDPLAFRPNPLALMSNDQGEDDDEDAHTTSTRQKRSIQDGDFDPKSTDIYHPPRVAPVPYIEKSKSQSRKERPPVPSALASLISDPSRPHIESTSGLGSTPTMNSGRAAYLKRLNDFEEENFSRIIMKKSDAKRRARDEEDLALGGGLSGGSGRYRQRAGGLADEFNDVLKSVSRRSGQGQKDGYEELREKGKKGSAFERSRSRTGGGRERDEDGDFDEVEGRSRKRTRFEQDTKSLKRKVSRRKQ